MKFLIVFLSLSILPRSSTLPCEGRIFGGCEAPVNAFPWMVSVRFNNGLNSPHLCGGSILTDTYVLTAASCFYDAQENTQYFSIRAGIRDLFNPNLTMEQYRSISKISVHPSYNSTENINDIALVRVSSPFVFDPSLVWNISLANINQLQDLDLVIVGWGILNQSNPTIGANYLQQLSVREDTQCTIDLTTNSTTQLCATGNSFSFAFFQ